MGLYVINKDDELYRVEQTWENTDEPLLNKEGNPIEFLGEIVYKQKMTSQRKVHVPFHGIMRLSCFTNENKWLILYLKFTDGILIKIQEDRGY